MSDTGSEEQVTPEEPDKYRLILTSNPAFLNAALIISFCLIPLAFVILWFIWFTILPAVWSWSFDTFSWRILPGIIGIFFIAFLPVWVPVVAFKVVAWMLEIYADESTKKDVRYLNEVVHYNPMLRMSWQNRIRVDWFHCCVIVACNWNLITP